MHANFLFWFRMRHLRWFILYPINTANPKAPAAKKTAKESKKRAAVAAAPVEAPTVNDVDEPLDGGKCFAD